MKPVHVVGYGMSDALGINPHLQKILCPLIELNGNIFNECLNSAIEMFQKQLED